jgi:uncharacterized protein
VIYVDSCIPMYLVGAAHPNKSRVIELLSSLLDAREQLVTSVEAFQEIIHRYKSLDKLESLQWAYSAFEQLCDEVVDLVKADVDQAKMTAVEYRNLSSRDCLHVAVMKRLSCTKIWTFDKAFAELPGLSVVQ